MRLALDPKTPWDDALDALGELAAQRRRQRSSGSSRISRSPPDGPEELLTVIRVALPRRAAATGLRALRLALALAGRPLRPRRRQSRRRPRRLPRDAVERAARRTRRGTALGLGALAVSRGRRRARRASAASSSCTATRRTTRGRTPRTPIRSARFRLNLDAGSGLTGLAKMAVIRGNEAKVLTALGPTNRMLDG